MGIGGGSAITAEAEGNLIGRINHFCSHLSAGITELTEGDLNVGGVIYVKGKHTDFTQTVDSIQIEHQSVSHAEKGKLV